MNIISTKTLNDINESSDVLSALQEVCGADKDKVNPGFVCPICNSGSGIKGTGVKYFKQGKVYKCFSCGKANSAINWYRKATNKSFVQAVNDLSDRMGISIIYDNDSDSSKGILGKEYRKDNDVPKDFSSLYQTASRSLEKTDYWKKRGLSLEVCKKYNIGFSYHTVKGKNYPYLLLPSSKSFFVKRYIEDYPAGSKTHIEKGTHVVPFNADAFKTAYETKQPVFIVEGAIDALSIIEAGGLAVGMNGAVMKKAILQSIKSFNFEKFDFPIYIALDSDEPGIRAAKSLGTALYAEGIPSMVCNIFSDCKDANDLLLKDKEKLINNIHNIIFEADDYSAEKMEQEAKEKREKEDMGLTFVDHALSKDEKENFRNLVASNLAANCFDKFLNRVKNQQPPITTGFDALDKVLGGGLYQGLYVCGAVTSLGKTTFFMQIADHIAEFEGKDVLIFSLEMSRDELIARSLSRNTYIIAKENNLDLSFAKTAREISIGTSYSKFNNYELALIADAAERYKDYSNHVYIYEGMDTTADDIRNMVEAHIRVTGNIPVVIIDYLQIIEPLNPKATDKMNMDKAMKRIKVMCHQLHLTTLAISSFSRAAYNNEAKIENMKESGGLEYTADNVLGLNFDGIGEEGFDLNRARKAFPRKIELTVLKQRHGEVGSKICYNFYSKFYYFEETGIKL